MNVILQDKQNCTFCLLAVRPFELPLPRRFRPLNLLSSLCKAKPYIHFSSCLQAYRPRYSRGPCPCLIELHWVISKLLDSCVRAFGYLEHHPTGAISPFIPKALTYGVVHENLPRSQPSKLHLWTTVDIQCPLELEIRSPTEPNLNCSPNSFHFQYLHVALSLTP